MANGQEPGYRADARLDDSVADTCDNNGQSSLNNAASSARYYQPRGVPRGDSPFGEPKSRSQPFPHNEGVRGGPKAPRPSPKGRRVTTLITRQRNRPPKRRSFGFVNRQNGALPPLNTGNTLAGFVRNIANAPNIKHALIEFRQNSNQRPLYWGGHEVGWIDPHTRACSGACTASLLRKTDTAQSCFPVPAKYSGRPSAARRSHL